MRAARLIGCLGLLLIAWGVCPAATAKYDAKALLADCPSEHLHLGADAAIFETFLAATDGAAAQPTPADFTWKLHKGQNSLKVHPRNAAGRDGIASLVVVEYR